MVKVLGLYNKNHNKVGGNVCILVRSDLIYSIKNVWESCIVEQFIYLLIIVYVITVMKHCELADISINMVIFH